MRIKIIIFTALLSLLFLCNICNTSAKEISSPQNELAPFTTFKIIFLPDAQIHFDCEEYKKTLPPSDISIKICPTNPTKDQRVMFRESFSIFQDVLKNIKENKDFTNEPKETDFIVFGGNLIQNSDKKLENLFFAVDAIENSTLKYYAILGNREVDLEENSTEISTKGFTKGFTKNSFCSEFRRNGFNNTNSDNKNEKFPEYLTYWKQNPQENIVLIGLDTSLYNSPLGEISSEQLQWLDKTLSDNKENFTIIAMHHPAIPLGFENKSSESNDYLHYLNNSKEFLDIIFKYPQVKLVLSGHNYNYAIKKINGAVFISLPSITVYPNSYKILHIAPTGLKIENKNISYSQIVKKSKNQLLKSDFANWFDSKNPSKASKFLRGNKFLKIKKIKF